MTFFQWVFQENVVKKAIFYRNYGRHFVLDVTSKYVLLESCFNVSNTIFSDMSKLTYRNRCSYWPYTRNCRISTTSLFTSGAKQVTLQSRELHKIGWIGWIRIVIDWNCLNNEGLSNSKVNFKMADNSDSNRVSTRVKYRQNTEPRAFFYS